MSNFPLSKQEPGRLLIPLPPGTTIAQPPPTPPPSVVVVSPLLFWLVSPDLCLSSSTPLSSLLLLYFYFCSLSPVSDRLLSFSLSCPLRSSTLLCEDCFCIPDAWLLSFWRPFCTTAAAESANTHTHTAVLWRLPGIHRLTDTTAAVPRERDCVCKSVLQVPSNNHQDCTATLLHSQDSLSPVPGSFATAEAAVS